MKLAASLVSIGLLVVGSISVKMMIPSSRASSCSWCWPLLLARSDEPESTSTLMVTLEEVEQKEDEPSRAVTNGSSAIFGNTSYRIANSETFDTSYSGKEYFDVYSNPIRTLYSQVHWRNHFNISLPEHIAKRFEGKVMAVTGYEVDQVMLDPNTNHEVPVPITWAYNHHYAAWLLSGKKVQLVEEETTGMSARLNHGAAKHLVPKRVHADDEEIVEYPMAQWFSEGNGGEMRRSYHGYPKGYAQLIQSPDTFHVVPMQIDTWNRNASGAEYVPGAPLPKSSRIPRSAGYSGLVECPCSDRLKKEWHITYAAATTTDSSGGQCINGRVQNATECFAAARQVLVAESVRETEASIPSLAAGCSATLHANGSMVILWNSKAASGSLVEKEEENGAVDGKETTVVGTALGVVNMTVALAADVVRLKLVGPADRWLGVGFDTSSMCLRMQSDECPTGGPYAIVVTEDGGGAGDENVTVTERKLDFHGPGSILKSSIKVESNTVVDGVRTVRLVRAARGLTENHYTFHTASPDLPVILATGCGRAFSQHCGHGSSTIHFMPVETPVNICRAGIEGRLGGNIFDSKNRCAPHPTSDLLDQHNPTCQIQTYTGGLSCCRDGESLLDVGQANPWPDQYLEYRLKFRFYFEEYRKPANIAASEGTSYATTSNVKASHKNLVRAYWQTESFAGEYDIVQCEPGTPKSQCVQVITSKWQVRDFLHDCDLHDDASYCTGKGSADDNKTAGIKLIYAGPHCHASTCLSMELYNADTGRLLCGVEPIYGHTGNVYDERGFLTIPPCLWGDPDDGLSEPKLLTLNTTLLSIKRNNSTLSHTGEMASWQMRAIVVPRLIDDEAPTPTLQEQHLASRLPLLRHVSDASVRYDYIRK